MFRSIVSVLVLSASLSSTAFAESAEFTAVEIEKRSAGTFYIDGAIDGAGELDMLVDTGSSYLVITEPMLATLKTAGRATYSRGLEGHMADGSVRVVPLYKIDSIRLGAGCWVHDVEAAIFPAGSRTILGMNVLSRLAPFTFSAEPASLGLAHCQGPPAPAATQALQESLGADGVPVDSGSGAGHAAQ